jgi:hypothetical protein
MKYKYQFDEIVFDSGSKMRIIIMEDYKYRLVAQALMSNIEGADAWNDYYYAIDKVLSGRSEYEELNGNACSVEIHRDKTQIYDNLAEDGRGDWCEIETKELRDLIDIWFAELKRFRAQE